MDESKVLLEEKRYTAQDFEKLPEGPPYYELIERELIMSPAPILDHQDASKKLFHKLYTFVELSKQGYVFYSSVDVYLDERNVFQPDIVVVLKKSKARRERKGIIGPPML
jgi:Uma2 family endonuclease